ncbi:hypothetical protein BDZ90DRAFT_280324 [Jaminaea rosea]|uniref:START domain-containing protein n=1 Tax=Jaminaea rosea TaxID=1569628 RepID=A0A316UR97_9BASI|nr:hypothetical protein BDZ90DRAFT_280324 [Jaminaea rosea]PWN26841.1 hypothetical protein BDZ90DRAFT_280324 [Jaminaea rosea]
MDGGNLTAAKAQWDEALQSAIRSFRLLASQSSSSSKAWKPVVPPPAAQAASSSSTSAQPRTVPSTPAGSVAQRNGSRRPSVAPAGMTPNASPVKGKSRDDGRFASFPSSPSQQRVSSGRAAAASFPSRALPFAPQSVESSAVRIHKRSGGKSIGLPTGVDVYRAVVDVPFDGVPDLEGFKASLGVPEARTKWDKLVDEAETVEMLDPRTRISRTRWKLGWPASPRDAITISRSMSDESTLVNVSTSLPRSADAPAYLKPAPPCVRSHVHLFACCVQLPDAEAVEDLLDNGPSPDSPAIRLTLFWAWDLRGAWLGMPAGGLGSHCTAMAVGLVKHVRSGASHLPSLSLYGSNVEVLSTAFDVSRDTLSTSYCVLGDDPTTPGQIGGSSKASEDASEDALHMRRKTMGTAIQFALPAEEGWDVKVLIRPQVLEEGSSAEWRATATREKGPLSSSSRIVLNIDHDRLPGAEESVRSQVNIQRIAASSDIRLRINDETVPITDVVPSTQPTIEPAGAPGLALLDEAASLSNISIASTASHERSSDSHHHRADSISQFTFSKRATTLASIIRRNYIYFTSMLQEPEAKWKHLSDSRGVTVTQLDSIDPTLVVYRAEATFVGVGVWDLFASISSPGTRTYWDKTLEEAKLIEDVDDVSAVWHTKTKAAWPVSARDAVMVETSYKSPSSVHTFSFSTDETTLFPSIPSTAPGVIRTQVDLRGWSIESLSPTTVHVTLIEQSDPKGWTSKSATPALMTASVAGVGEHAIKLGAPPVLTRMLGARLSDAKYDVEKATFRIEYSRTDGDEEEQPLLTSGSHNVECEMRCDIETWCGNLDLLVDPPPINVSCLRRHKLSPGGGGLWLTIEHHPASLEDDSAKVTVRRGSPAGKERGVVTVNGARLKVDVDEMKEDELAQLKDKKRSKPQRVPLDLKQSSAREGSDMAGSYDSGASSSIPSRVGTPASAAKDTSSTAVAEITQPAAATNANTHTPFSDKQPKHAMTPALDVLFLLRRIYAERSPDPTVNPAGWAMVTQRNGLFIRRKMMQSISPTIAVQRGDKVVQGVTAEDMVAVISSLSCRKQWDERIETTKFLESYGEGATSSFVTTTGAFPFRGRGFFMSSLSATATPTSQEDGLDGLGSPSTPSFTAQRVYYHASASFPEETSTFDSAKLNPNALPVGRVLIDGWIFETLDPYSSTLNYQIPSTRCTHVVAVDYAGSLPFTVNTLWNANLPRSILAVESFLKARGAIPAVRAPPPHFKVLGDGRDEDNDFAWVVEEPIRKRETILLLSNFSPADKRFEVLLHAPPLGEEQKQLGGSQRQPAVSNAASTKAAAAQALSIPRSPSLNDTQPQQQRPSSSQGHHKLLKATSSTSLRSNPGFSASATSSAIRTPRASLRASDVAAATRPIVLADIEVELKHYMAGYKIDVFSQFGPRPPATRLAAERSPNVSLAEGVAQEGGDEAKTPMMEKPAPELMSTDSVKSKPEPLSLSSIAKSKKDLPVEVTIYELPPSAVLAATLDPSVRPRRHLVRVSLPVETVTKPPQDDDDADSCRTDAIDWRQQLRERGAAIRLTLRPTQPEPVSRAASPAPNGSATSQPQDLEAAAAVGATDEIDPQQVPVHYAGRRLDVVHVNKTSAMLQREHDLDPAVSRLSRAPRGKEGEQEVIPAMLASPAATASDAKKSRGEKKGGESSVTATSTSAAGSSGSAEAQKGDKGADSASVASHQSGKRDSVSSTAPSTSSGTMAAQTAATASSAATSLMGLLQSYPLSRIGASTAVSNVSANGEAGGASKSATSSLSSRTGKGKEKGENEAKDGKGAPATGTADGSSSTTNKPEGSQESKSTDPATGPAGSTTPLLLGGPLLHEARYSLATLLSIALICFLAGSLLRAMLSPADFIYFARRDDAAASVFSGGGAGVGKQAIKKGAIDAASAAKGEIERLVAGQGPAAEGLGMGASVAWRKVLRLLEIKRAIGGRFDLVLAVVDRR